MLDATRAGDLTIGLDAERPNVEAARPKRRAPAREREPIAGPSFSSANVFEAPAVMAASFAMGPIAFAVEAQTMMRRSRALSIAWMQALGRCRSPQDLIDVNAKFGERALALGFGECFRVVERGALMGRTTVAPTSLALRSSA